MPYNHATARYAVITAVIEQQKLADHKSGDGNGVEQGGYAGLLP